MLEGVLEELERELHALRELNKSQQRTNIFLDGQIYGVNNAIKTIKRGIKNEI